MRNDDSSGVGEERSFRGRPSCVEDAVASNHRSWDGEPPGNEAYLQMELGYALVGNATLTVECTRCVDPAAAFEEGIRQVDVGNNSCSSSWILH